MVAAVGRHYTGTNFSYGICMLNIETIIDWLSRRAGGLYGGEPVTQLEHALQCASRAQADGATPSLVTAALLHDLGHLSDTPDDARHPHEELAASQLQPLFGAAVTEPIRLHVAAKRYLCVSDPAYWTNLSPMSKQSLEWQGGAYTVAQAASFIIQPHASDAVRLRQWDDASKIPGQSTGSLPHFVAIMLGVALPQVELKLAGKRQ